MSTAHRREHLEMTLTAVGESMDAALAG